MSNVAAGRSGGRRTFPHCAVPSASMVCGIMVCILLSVLRVEMEA